MIHCDCTIQLVKYLVEREVFWEAKERNFLHYQTQLENEIKELKAERDRIEYP